MPNAVFFLIVFLFTRCDLVIMIKLLAVFVYFLLYFYYFFISIFILLTRRKATEALIHRVSNYPDLLPEIPRYCCPLVI